MPAINEAYRVLGDPARRAVYDAGLRRARSSSPPTASEPASAYTAPMHPSHLGPARIPWRSLMVVGIIGVIGVVVLAQFTEPGEPSGPRRHPRRRQLCCDRDERFRTGGALHA